MDDNEGHGGDSNSCNRREKRFGGFGLSSYTVRQFAKLHKSGMLLAIGAFLGSSNVLARSGTTELPQWAEALDKGCVAISELDGAKLGDRTMLDAIDPFVKTLKKRIGRKTSREAVYAAVEAAERGVEATAQMKTRVGWSSYLGDRALGYPDPGAKAITVWLGAASEALFLH
jgi:dihydroxyacetone kinase